MHMIPFKPLTAPQELDFYTIFEDQGVKYIHVFGYSYKSDSMEYVSEENPDGVYWANMECSWFILPLEELLAGMKENEDFIDETYEGLNQYQDDLTPEEMTDCINHYFDGHCADAYLYFGELTMDTPCGDYVSYSRNWKGEIA